MNLLLNKKQIQIIQEGCFRRDSLLLLTRIRTYQQCKFYSAFTACTERPDRNCSIV